MTTARDIINISDFLVRYACENTTNGNFIIDTDKIFAATGMGFMEILQYRDEIMEEMYEYEEILDVEYDTYNDCFDIACSLDYCPQYVD